MPGSFWGVAVVATGLHFFAAYVFVLIVPRLHFFVEFVELRRKQASQCQTRLWMPRHGCDGSPSSPAGKAGNAMELSLSRHFGLALNVYVSNSLEDYCSEMLDLGFQNSTHGGSNACNACCLLVACRAERPA